MSNATSSLDRGSAAQRAIDRNESAVTPGFGGLWEYTIVAVTPEGIDATCTAPGMPALQRLPVTGLVGPLTSVASIGSKVLVAFVNQQPSRPFVLSVAITQTMLTDALATSAPGPVTVTRPIVALMVVP